MHRHHEIEVQSMHWERVENISRARTQCLFPGTESTSRVEVTTLLTFPTDLNLSEQFAVLLRPSDATKREKEFPKDFAHYPYK